MNFDLPANLIATFAGAIATLVIGGIATWHTRKALRIQLAQLDLAQKEAERKREEAEQARAKAEREAEEARKAKEACQRKAETYARQYENAPKRFTQIIGEHIDKAVSAANTKGATSQELLIEARALVKARDGLRSSLEGIQQRLNSSIDALHREVERKPPSSAEIEATVKVLQSSWPAKTAEIELAVRKILVDMGIEQVRE